MNPHQLEAMCQRLHLGALVGVAQLMADGRLHQRWHMETTQGSYVV